MDSNNFETLFIKDEISRCEDAGELRERILPMIKTQQEQWAHKINDIIAESGFTKTKFADMCRVTRPTVNNWCKKGVIPRDRERFLRIGMAAGYGREKMDQFLQRYGQYPALYAKSLEDCVCIFVLNKEYGEETLTKYNYILDKIKENIIRSDEAEDMSTVLFDEKLSNVKNEDELEQFIAENTAIFSDSFRKLYAYVMANIEANYYWNNKGNIFDLAETMDWSSSLKHCVYEIKQGKWYPTRNKIISLGLHLSMDHDQIDEMLKLAHMEPLYAKNAFESVIMFILDDASLNNMLDTELEGYDPDALCRYARKVLKEIDLPEAESFITEISEIYDEDDACEKSK